MQQTQGNNFFKKRQTIMRYFNTLWRGKLIKTEDMKGESISMAKKLLKKYFCCFSKYVSLSSFKSESLFVH